MAMTKKTITVFSDNRPTDEDTEYNNERVAFMQTMVDDGKADALRGTLLADGSLQRNWLDESAANEFVTFFNGLTAKYNFVQTTTISDL